MSARLVVPALFISVLAAQNAPVYKDYNAPVEKRVDDLVSRMTLEEKASQMLSDAPAIDRLGIPAYNWWNECLHGVARAGVATVFPEPIGMAATWDENLFHRIGTAISDEARAKHHEFLRQGKRGIYQGLTFWTPNINLFRDPRWGRGMETYGEDPYLTGRLAVQFIRGLQGDDPKYLKTIATAKHYAVHSGPESERHTFDARVSEKELWDTYLPHFEDAVREGGAWSVMCAYNLINGFPACAQPKLEGAILRDEWKFPGYVVSDCGAIGDIYTTHKSAADAQHGVAMAVKNGTDLDCGLEYQNIVPAVRAGLISEEDVNRSVRRLFEARFRLGMFDPPERVRYAQIPYSVNNSHGALALETARKSIVLLKNDGVLPLRKTMRTIGVIGPNADNLEALLGNYNGDPTSPVTPLEGIRRKVGGKMKVLYAPGSDLAANMPVFETVPPSALFTTDGTDKKPGLRAEYYETANFNGRAYFGRDFVPRAMREAAVVPKEPKPLFARLDPNIEFQWRDKAPRADMNDDNFGVRWTGYLLPPASGRYKLGVQGKNAAELYLDGKRIAAFNTVHDNATAYADVTLDADKLYALRVDFHEMINDANIRLVWSHDHPDWRAEALSVARQSDAVVMVLGLSPRLEGEEMRVQVEGFKGGDRITLDLPRVQQELLESVVATGKPVVVVLMNGSALAVNWAQQHVPAIVELWYPGQAGGDALADVLFGDYNPAGRLPVTFYKSERDIPPFTDYNMRGKTYRFFEGQPLFPFGYGMSYTRFTYRNLYMPSGASAGSPMTLQVEVANAGDRDGEEVVQVYVRRLDAAPGDPMRSLIGFKRLALKRGESKSVGFPLMPAQLATVDEQGRRAVRPGTIEISVGGGQLAGAASTTQVLTGRITLTGAAKPID